MTGMNKLHGGEVDTNVKPDHNPANERDIDREARERIPMSTAQRKLEVPERPGYRRYWFADEPGRIERAKRAGYVLVRPADVEPNQRGIGTDTTVSGNNSLGDDVRVTSHHNGQRVVSLVLMEIPMEHYLDDQKKIALENGKRLQAIYRNVPGMERESQRDREQVYVDAERTRLPTPLFSRPPRKEA